MNSILLAHVGAEILVFAGLSLYFSKKFNEQKSEIQQLKQKIQELEKVLVSHDRVLRLILDDGSGNNSSRPTFSNEQRDKRSFSGKSEENKCDGSTCPVPPPPSKPKQTKPDFDSNKLDELLQDEYTQLESERNSKSEEQPTNSSAKTDSPSKCDYTPTPTTGMIYTKNVKGGATIELLDSEE